MSAFTNKIAFVIPTKDRPGDLRRMLASVEMQPHTPDQIIIVDGGDERVHGVTDEFPNLNIQYIRVYPPSLARQRNAGMERVDPSITLAGYLDDDLLLEPGAIEAMLSFWAKAPEDVGGAAFNIINHPPSRATGLKLLFLMDSRKRGAVLPSGYHTPIGRVDETKYVRWLYGGATIWRRQVIEEFQYDEWFEGTGHFEDVDYSFTVGKKYKLAVVASAQVQHLPYPVRKDRNYLLGKWQVINRMYFVKKHPELSVPLYYWAVAGELIFNVAASIWDRDSGRLRRALGNCVGLVRVAVGRIERMGGSFK